MGITDLFEGKEVTYDAVLSKKVDSSLTSKIDHLLALCDRWLLSRKGERSNLLDMGDTGKAYAMKLLEGISIRHHEIELFVQNIPPLENPKLANEAGMFLGYMVQQSFNQGNNNFYLQPTLPLYGLCSNLEGTEERSVILSIDGDNMNVFAFADAHYVHATLHCEVGYEFASGAQDSVFYIHNPSDFLKSTGRFAANCEWHITSDKYFNRIHYLDRYTGKHYLISEDGSETQVFPKR